MFLLKKKLLQNFGRIVNQQLHLYKNTLFSVRATKVAQLTLKASFILLTVYLEAEDET